MIRHLRLVAMLATALAASSAYAQAPAPAWSPDQGSAGWDRNEWARPFNERPGYENLNDCQPGAHGIPFPNGNGFLCVPDGY
jgi:hypothetical protein